LVPDKRRRGLYPQWRPRPATVRVLEAVDAVLLRYSDHLPLTLRQIFYAVSSAEGGVLDKTEDDYRSLCEKVGMARRAGRIEWAAIRDDTQVCVHAPAGFGDTDHFLGLMRQAAEGYRIDRQAGQPVRLEVWCETGGMTVQLAKVAGQYGIDVHSGGGFDSLSGKHAAALRAADNPEIETHILHIGDDDPSGVHVYSSLAEDVIAFASSFGARVVFQRVAVTPAQAARYGLPTAPRKASDNRKFEGQDTTQAEALPPDLLASLLTEAIEAHRDPDVHRQVLEREEADRNRLRGLLGADEDD
jgi:urease beta subunit